MGLAAGVWLARGFLWDYIGAEIRFILKLVGTGIGVGGVGALGRGTWLRFLRKSRVEFPWLQGVEDIVGTNNRRLVLLGMITVVIFFIACFNPGDALFTTVRESISRNDGVQDVWEFFLYGSPRPPTVEMSIVEPGSWFWWQAFILYLLATLIYLPVAFRDEIAEAWKAARVKSEEQREKERDHQKALAEIQSKAKGGKGGKSAQNQDAGETTLPSLTRGGTFTLWRRLIPIEIAGEFIGEFLERLLARLARRAVMGGDK